MWPIPIATFTGPGDAGADITCDVITASIIHGRDDHASQPEADTITFEIWGPIPDGIDIGSALHVDAVIPDAAAARSPAARTGTVVGRHGPAAATDHLVVASTVDIRIRVSRPVTMTGIEVQMGPGASTTRNWYAMLSSEPDLVNLATGDDVPVPGPLIPTVLPLAYPLAANTDYRIAVQAPGAFNTSAVAGFGFAALPYVKTGVFITPALGDYFERGGGTAMVPCQPCIGMVEGALPTYRRFTGRVTDIELTWQERADQPTCTVTAAGSLATMGHTIIDGASMPAEMDGERANRVIADTGLPTDAGLSDSPGTIHVIGRIADMETSLQLAQDAAEDGGGVLWQTRDGLVLYADAVHRDGKALDLALLCSTIPLDITWVKNLEGMCNDATITYYEDVAGTLTAFETRVWDDDSIERHGLYAAALGTRIAGEGDAITRGARLIFAQAEPAWRVAGVGLHLEMLDKMGLDPAEDLAMTEAILGLEMHDLVSVVGMPYGSPINPSYLFIEGWTETIAFGSWHVVFAVSDFCQTGQDETWDEVDLVSTWQTYGYGEPLTWDDLPCHPPPGA